MSATMAILTIGVVPVSEVLPLLTEHIREDQITHISLLGKMNRADVMEEYAPEPGEERLLVLLNDNQFVEVSRPKVELSLQAVIEVLDNQSYDVILLLNTFKLRNMVARNAMLLEPQRIIPPLVASIVEGHQVGVLVPVEGILNAQQEKWQMLPTSPYYALANHLDGEVKIRFDVGANGKVEKMWILTSEPQHLFDDAVISAVAKWRFESNKPYKGMTKTIRFKLNNAG